MDRSITVPTPPTLFCYQPSEIPAVGKVFLMPYSVEIFSHRWVKGYFSTRNIESMRNEFKQDGIPDCIEEAAKILELQFKVHAGYARGLMSTLRHFPLTKLKSQFASSQQQSYPVQILWVIISDSFCVVLCCLFCFCAYLTRCSFYGMALVFFGLLHPAACAYSWGLHAFL